MNGKHIADLTLDNITDWLGRPSAIKDNEAFGMGVYYHERGLVFNVVHQKYDGQQHCSEIHIYLSRSWDNLFSKFFLPYTGVISKNLDSNWKIDRLKSEFLRIRITDYDDDRMIKICCRLKIFSEEMWISIGIFLLNLELIWKRKTAGLLLSMSHMLSFLNGSASQRVSQRKRKILNRNQAPERHTA
jgi:hypothetical protein